MLMKYLHKFYNRDDIPWVGLVWESYYSNGRLPGNISKGSFWWKDVTKLIHKFKSIAKVDLKDGMTCMFWSDMWLGMIPETSFPELYSFAKTKTTTFSSAMNEHSFQNLFHLPLSEEAFSQFTQLQNLMDSFHFDDARDTWGYNWGSNFFSSSKVYKQLRSNNPVSTKFRWLWNSSCQNKHRVFFWLILQNRLNTRGVLRRRNMELENYHCVLCTKQHEESIEHLFLSCPFAAEAWNSINLNVDADLLPIQNLDFLREQINQSFFMEIIILFCWAIWMSRNNLIFRQVPPSVQSCRLIFKSEFY